MNLLHCFILETIMADKLDTGEIFTLFSQVKSAIATISEPTETLKWLNFTNLWRIKFQVKD